jgi:hypothetical protein
MLILKRDFSHDSGQTKYELLSATSFAREYLITTEMYLSLTDRELYAAAKRLDEHNTRTEDKYPSEKQIHTFKTYKECSIPATSAELCDQQGVEEVEADTSTLIDKAFADRLRRAFL